MGHLFERRELFFAAAARVVDLEPLIVADAREEVCVEEGAVVGELRGLVAIAEAAGDVRDLEGEVGDVTGCERLVEGVDGVEAAGRAADEMKWAVELDVGYGLMPVGEVDLGERLRGFVLKREDAGAVEGAAFGIDVDGGFDGGDFGLSR